MPHISGGVGEDARQELLAKERDYSLKIVVAEKSGDYLAATFGAKTLTQRVTVATQGLRQVDFRWDVAP